MRFLATLFVLSGLLPAQEPLPTFHQEVALSTVTIGGDLFLLATWDPAKVDEHRFVRFYPSLPDAPGSWILNIEALMVVDPRPCAWRSTLQLSTGTDGHPYYDWHLSSITNGVFTSTTHVPMRAIVPLAFTYYGMRYTVTGCPTATPSSITLLMRVSWA